MAYYKRALTLPQLEQLRQKLTRELKQATENGYRLGTNMGHAQWERLAEALDAEVRQRQEGSEAGGEDAPDHPATPSPPSRRPRTTTRRRRGA